jgi:hypothetical protein
MSRSLRYGFKAAIVAIGTLWLIAPASAPAQLFVNDPVLQTGPIEGNDPLVGLAIPGATPAEYRAHLIWNLRSGLNVAALQCQFSPFLRTVENYNAFLVHHGTELAAAYSALEGYFRRVAGRNGPRNFDQYSTQTYNNFSTLRAQLGFCQTASRLAKEALARPKGQLGQFATARMREFRSSLTPAYDGLASTRNPIILAPLPGVGRRDCSQLRGRERRECEQQN